MKFKHMRFCEDIWPYIIFLILHALVFWWVKPWKQCLSYQADHKKWKKECRQRVSQGAQIIVWNKEMVVIIFIIIALGISRDDYQEQNKTQGRQLW